MTTTMLDPVSPRRSMATHEQILPRSTHAWAIRTTQPKVTATEAIKFGVAQTLDEVIQAWRLVYDVYRATGLINPNPYLIHTTPQCVSPRTAVLHGRIADRTEATLTAIVDDVDSPDPQGLPLDTVYKKELDQLRAQGRHLTEYGLFAHRGQLLWETSWGQVRGTFDHNEPQKSACLKQSIYELMRLAFFFGLTRNSTDFVIGVHPRHMRFYRRAFGFKQVGPPKRYSTVNNNPVVLLHGSLAESLAAVRTPYALASCLDHPVPLETYARRYRFNTWSSGQQQVQAA